MDLVVVTISLLSIFFGAVNLVLSYQLYKKFLRRSFMFVGGGLFIVSNLGLIYLFPELTGDAELSTKMLWTMIILTIAFGTTFTPFGLRALLEANFPTRFYIFALANTLVIPYVTAFNSYVSITSEGWELVYEPFYLVTLLLLALVGAVIEIDWNVYLLIRDSQFNRVKQLFYVMLVSSVVMVLFFGLRLVIDTPPNLYLLPFVFFELSVGAIIYLYPEVFLTSSITPQFLLIIDGRQGTPLKSYSFVENKLQGSDDTLISAALSAIQALANEFSVQALQLTGIGFEDLHLHASIKGPYRFYLAASKQSFSLTYQINALADAWDLNVQGHSITKEDDRAMDQVVETAFVHQMNRLDLFLKTLDH